MRGKGVLSDQRCSVAGAAWVEGCLGGRGEWRCTGKRASKGAGARGSQGCGRRRRLRDSEALMSFGP